MSTIIPCLHAMVVQVSRLSWRDVTCLPQLCDTHVRNIPHRCSDWMKVKSRTEYFDTGTGLFDVNGFTRNVDLATENLVDYHPAKWSSAYRANSLLCAVPTSRSGFHLRVLVSVRSRLYNLVESGVRCRGSQKWHSFSLDSPRVDWPNVRPFPLTHDSALSAEHTFSRTG
ncbi:uncharacterized protein LOC105697518 [Orussus abietinus]|uniref:uncharacterized protein LOC105697518 n=1 Tax=Orussus abietinus TaxID=222816 RepID=UPI000626BC72|nr:uncharacterized protein LOC105697518 [Orussus abietinus]